MAEKPSEKQLQARNRIDLQILKRLIKVTLSLKEYAVAGVGEELEEAIDE